MEIEGLSDYAMRMASPHVSGFLYQLHLYFTCGRRWTRTAYHLFGSDQAILAAPVDEEAYLSYILPDINGNIALGEYTWYGSSKLPPRQRQPTGRVNLKAAVSALIDIPKGTDAYLSEDGNMPGFLCWAEAYPLSDESKCYRIQTTGGGALWLLPHGAKADIMELFDMPRLPYGNRAQVVHLAEASCYMPHLQQTMLGNGPWSGFESRDESGRIWRIEKNSLSFSATMRLKVRKYNERLRTLPTAVLQPPYRVIWQPEVCLRFGIPLTLTAKA